MLPTVIRLRKFVQVPFRDLPLTRRNLLQRDNHCCQYCGSNQEKLSIDHVIPRSRGGKDNWENVTTACLSCNAKKGSKTPQEAGMLIAHTPWRPRSKPSFEAMRLIHAGHHQEWKKYVIGWH